MKSTFSLSILLIILFIIPSLSAQNLKLEKAQDEPEGQAYQTTISGLNELQPATQSITHPPFYTSFIIYNSGFYERIEISEEVDPTYSSVRFGSSMSGSQAEATAYNTSRYSNDEPPERNVVVSDSVAIENPANYSTFNAKLNRGDDCIAIDTNHSIIADRMNILAISLRPKNGDQVYLFYNKKNSGEGGDGAPVEIFKSFSKNVQQPHYVTASEIEELSAVEFDGTYSKFFFNGGFNNVIQYKFDPTIDLPEEWRLFIGLDNDGVIKDEVYEFLVIQTISLDEGEVEICKGNEINSSRLEEVEQMLGEELMIGKQTISAYKYANLTVEPPNDPNVIWPTDACSCGDIRDSTSASLKNYYFSFQFCNESTSPSTQPAAPAITAQITFDDLSSIPHCIEPAEGTIDRITKDPANPMRWTLGVKLQDLAFFNDYSLCCDTIFFVASQGSIGLPDIYPKISACVIFNGSTTAEPVCDTFMCSPAPYNRYSKDCQLSIQIKKSCNHFLTFDCQGNRYRCSSLLPIFVAAIGSLLFGGFFLYRKRKGS